MIGYNLGRNIWHKIWTKKTFAARPLPPINNVVFFQQNQIFGFESDRCSPSLGHAIIFSQNILSIVNGGEGEGQHCIWGEGAPANWEPWGVFFM